MQQFHTVTLISFSYNQSKCLDFMIIECQLMFRGKIIKVKFLLFLKRRPGIREGDINYLGK